jgi:hypothetical protein
MLLFGLGIGLIIAGIVALVTGRMKFSKNRAVQGVPARLLGVALLTPLPLGFLAAMIYTMAHIDPNKPDQAQQWAQQHDGAITAVMAGTMIGLAVLIIVIAAFLAKPIKPAKRRKRRDRDDDFEDDDRPRRRRDELEDDDRPRRRRPAAEDEEDEDRPRRRRRDDLDDRAR